MQAMSEEVKANNANFINIVQDVENKISNIQENIETILKILTKWINLLALF